MTGPARIDVPKMSLTLTKADYRFYREFKWAVREWTLLDKGHNL